MGSSIAFANQSPANMNLSTEILIIGGLFVFFTTITLLATSRSRRRCHLLIRLWAEERNCAVLEQRLCILRGPFFWSCSRAQQVYRLKLRDSSGGIHEGWVKIGSGWLGIWTANAPLEWKGQTHEPPPLPVQGSPMPPLNGIQ